MSKILILHAPDVQSVSQVLHHDLTHRGHQVTLVSTAPNESTTKAIDEADLVVLVASPAFFNNCYLVFGAGHAMGTGKAVSILIKSTSVILPSWYKNHFSHAYTHADLLQKLSKLLLT